MPQFIFEEPVAVSPNVTPEREPAAAMDRDEIDALESRIAAGDIRPGQLAEMVPALIASIRAAWTATQVAMECERSTLEDSREFVASLRAEHDRRVSELLEANNREVERRQKVERERDWLALQIDVSRRIAAVRERLLGKVIGQRDELTGRVKVLEERARAVIDGAQSSYRARNGRQCSIEASDGERCLIVHFDLMHELSDALPRPQQADPAPRDVSAGTQPESQP